MDGKYINFDYVGNEDISFELYNSYFNNDDIYLGYVTYNTIKDMIESNKELKRLENKSEKKIDSTLIKERKRINDIGI